MKIVALSDTHSQHQHIKLPPGDIIIHAGDISLKGSRSELNNFLSWFASLPFTHKIFIAGNHDFMLDKLTEDAVKALLPEGVTYLKDSGIAINGVTIWGSPVTPWFYDWAFNRHRGAAIAKHWAQIPAITNVLVTHGPAYGILDTVQNGNRVGDKDLLRKLDVLKPAVHIFGHVHESYGRVKRGFTRHFNTSLMNEKYEMQNMPFVIDVGAPAS